ncbi:phosphatidylinositide phosphatase SAC2-like isoform X2 [Crassostrea virginica]
MQLFQSDDHYILHDGEYSLWCCRHSGTLEAKKGDDICLAWNPVCIGLVYGLIGKIKIHPDDDWKLLLIKQRMEVGCVMDEHKIYKVNKIVVLPLSDAEPQELDLDLCNVHHFGIRKPKTISQTGIQQKQLQNAWKTIKSGMDNVKPRKKDVKDKEKFVRRITEELLKMFTDSDSFYYSETFDLTTSLQRQHGQEYQSNKHLPLWQQVDPRFFWNSHMLDDLIQADRDPEEEKLYSHWIIPVIQGYVQMENCVLDFTQSSTSSQDLSPDYGNSRYLDPLEYQLGIISRRSIHRAGTRTKMRGLDETGACANYVETEQIIRFSHHVVSFLQIRGSIPVFWSQSGYKYRPPPRLTKGHKETHEAFCRHLDEQLALYSPILVINLAELVGKEKELCDAFLHHIIEYNSAHITYTSFDFHEHCRGMKFENVSILTDGVSDMIKEMRYCWLSREDTICEQRGVFRVNCVDCLDRTNVSQTAIARIVMETQLRKLGILPPDENLPLSCRKIFQVLWANNGDAISRQYAGTAALKGDYTRTGERKITGMMKDGVNSANRYYLRFKDSYRQATIDLMLGQAFNTEAMMLSSDRLDSSEGEEEEDSNELLEKEENLKMLIEDAKKMLIIEPEQCMGGWSLINADPQTGDEDRLDMDIILLLSQRSVYVAWYDDEEEQIVQYQRIFLEDIVKMEIGAEPSIFKSKFVCLRLYYQHYAEDGFFHTFRIPRTRLFNNMIIAVKNMEDARENLRAIHQAFSAAQEILSLKLELETKPKLDRKKTKPHPDVQNIYIEQQEKTLTNLHVPRDLSSGELSKMSGTPSPGPRSLKSSPRPSPANSPSQPRKNLFPNIVNITKNISSGIKLPKFNIPKLDKRGDTAKDSGNDKEMAMDRSENSVRRSRLSSHGSHDDCEIDLKDRHSHDFDDMVLRSCGILETSKMPASEYPIAQKPKPSSTEEREEEDKGVPKEEEESKSKKLTNVPKIQTPNTTTRKMHRIFDAIQQELEARIGDRECHTKFIFL